MIASEALELYLQHHDRLDRLRVGLVERLREALQGIKFHSLASRLKAPESLRAKLVRPDKTYSTLWDVTDLIGLRVTTYFEDSIGDVAQIIENSFKVDFHHTQDRLAHRDFRTFGYRSLHYVCAPEGEDQVRFEIQIRTLLQHAWAEIEHDLGYKASDSTPETIRRRFTRIAGLLELADEEFVSIRRDLRTYESSVKAAADMAFPLDRLSLEFLVHSALVRQSDESIAERLQRPLSDELFYPEYLLKMLRLAGFRGTRDVSEALQRSRQHLADIVEPYFAFTREAWRLSSNDLETVPRGYSLFFLSHSAILESTILAQNKVAKLAQFYRELDYPDDEHSAFQVAQGLIERLAGANYPPLQG